MANTRKSPMTAERPEVGHKVVRAKEVTEADCRNARDMRWMLQRRLGWNVAQIARVDGVHRLTVYRRLALLEGAPCLEMLDGSS